MVAAAEFVAGQLDQLNITLNLLGLKVSRKHRNMFLIKKSTLST